MADLADPESGSVCSLQLGANSEIASLQTPRQPTVPHTSDSYYPTSTNIKLQVLVCVTWIIEHLANKSVIYDIVSLPGHSQGQPLQ